jgi:hypothetical protein
VDEPFASRSEDTPPAYFVTGTAMVGDTSYTVSFETPGLAGSTGTFAVRGPLDPDDPAKANMGYSETVLNPPSGLALSTANGTLNITNASESHIAGDFQATGQVEGTSSGSRTLEGVFSVPFAVGKSAESPSAAHARADRVVHALLKALIQAEGATRNPLAP